MCCTADISTLSNTIIYAGHQIRDGQRVQVLAYQNKAESTGPNAMILPIPTDTPLEVENLIDTREGGEFLGVISKALGPKLRGLAFNGLIGAAAPQPPARVVEVGSYTVVLADRISQVPEALERVPANKRPKFSSEFLAGYGALYQDDGRATYAHRFVVCCWEGELEAEPIMLWWLPRDERLFIPTMDAHDGGPPKPGPVFTDHTIIIGVERDGVPIKPLLPDVPDTITSLLASRAQRHDVPWRCPNGDSWFADGVLERIALQ